MSDGMKLGLVGVLLVGAVGFWMMNREADNEDYSAEPVAAESREAPPQDAGDKKSKKKEKLEPPPASIREDIG